MPPVHARPASGFFGKLPWAGDFVQRRLPDALVRAWDAHVSGVLAVRPAAAAVDPPWALLCAPGACGASAWAGVVAGSVDRVGRRFPLLLARPCAADADAGGLLAAGLAWFAAAQDLLATSQVGGFDGTDVFDAAVAALPSPAPDAEAPTLRRGAHGGVDPHATAWLQCLGVGGSMWWRGQASPCVLRGLPDAAACARALAAPAAVEGGA
jgi:type VI secretion system protein ImpM